MWYHSDMDHLRVAEAMRDAALGAVDPYRATKTSVSNGSLPLEELSVIAIGKAAVPMYRAIEEMRKISHGLIITKHGYGFGLNSRNNRVVVESDHPVPGKASLTAGIIVKEFLQKYKPKHLVVLLSGGGSSLVTAPPTGISIEDIQHTTTLLLSCGATIHEINTIRKHLDQLKGGGLLRYFPIDSEVHTLVLSDVIGDDLSVIASGPTYWDTSTYEDALTILHSYGIYEQTPLSIRTHLFQGAQGIHPETKKRSDPGFAQVHHTIVANITLALDAAVIEAKKQGYFPILVERRQQGEARHIGIEIANRAISEYQKSLKTPVCLLYGGETTVTLTPTHGKGGRCQELVLSAGIEAQENPLFFYAFGTDGTDGPTDAAGAFIDHMIIQKAIHKNLDPISYLRTHNSYEFFSKTNSLINTGPTGTNVGDIMMAFL